MPSLVDLPRRTKESAYETIIQKSRDDANYFCEFVLKDEKGMYIKQSSIHKEINWHIDECRRQKKNCGVLAPWGHGKCFAAGEKIDTAEGEHIPIEKFTPKNRIFDAFGKPRTPAWHGPIGQKECYQVIFTSGRSQTATYDHPFLTQRGFVQAKDLLPTDRVKMAIPIPDGPLQNFPAKDAWLAGLYIGDGSYGKISCADNLVLNSLSVFGTLTYLGQYDYYLRGIGKILRSVGIHDRHAKQLPNIRKFDTESLRHFMAGWFDADGTVSFCNKYRIRKDGIRYAHSRSYRVELYSINKFWLEEAQYAFLRLGIATQLRLKNGRYKGFRHVSWRLTIEGKQRVKRFRDIIPTVSTKSKKLYDSAIDESRCETELLDGVRAVLPIGMRECWGFTMPGGVHAINGIVSHNTEQVAIGRSLQFIGENTNNRIFIVSNSDDNAKSRVSSIEKYIDQDKDYQQVFPQVKSANKEEWSRHKLIVDRTSRSKDGSIEAWGITTSGMGSRCDFLIVDDPVDLRNAVLNPAFRPQVKECFYNVWMSRLAPEGFVIYIATVWHNDDLTSELLKNTGYSFLVIKVSEDYSCLECESPFKGKFTIPLWEEKWSKDRLISKRKDIGERAFNRGYRQMALSDEDRTFPSALRIFKDRVSISDIVRPEWPRYGGCDPFGQMVVIFTLAQSPQGKRYPIDIRFGKWGPTETVLQLIDAYRTHRHQLICVENNAAQEAIIQWALEKGEASMPIAAFTTGKQKADPAVGLPGMEVEFANDSWTVPMGREPHEPDCQCGFCKWKRELMEHPIGAASDFVMASWFAREAARAASASAEGSAGESETIITAEEMGLERVTIGGTE